MKIPFTGISKTIKTVAVYILLLHNFNFSVQAQTSCFQNMNDYTYDSPIGGISMYSQVGDINSDGKPDIVFSNGVNEIYTMTGNGNGTFANSQSVFNGAQLSFCKLKDINNDGNLDVVSYFNNGNNSTGTKKIYVMLGTGTGTFNAPLTFSLSLLQYENPQDIVVADINNDTKQDIVFAITNVTTSRILSFNGNGNGTFAAPNTYTHSSLFNGSLCNAGGDFNNDGKADLITYGNKTTIHFGDVTGSFSSSTVSAVTTASADAQWAIVNADYNSDGNLDYVAIASRYAMVGLGNGLGGFTTSTVSIFSNYDSGGYPNSVSSVVTSSDVDNDGKLDIVYYGNNNSLSILKGNSLGGFTVSDKKLVLFGNGNSANINSADLNNDGKVDLITTGSFPGVSKIAVLINQGNLDFNGIKKFDFSTSQFQDNFAYEVTDINNDSKPDILMSGYDKENSKNFISVRLANASGAFSLPTVLSTTLIANANFNYMLIDDVNGDNNKDVLFLSSYPNNCYIYAGNGLGNFTYLNTFSITTTATIAKLADFNNDGSKDLFVLNGSSNTLSIFSGNGSGNFTLLNSFTLANQPYDFCIKDLNNDNNLDIAYVPFSAASVRVMYGNGTNSLTAAVSYSLNGGAFCVKAKDINNDGKSDIVVGHYAAGNNIGVLLGTAAGTFQPVSYYMAGAVNNGWVKSIEIEDANNDGKQDIISANYTSYDVSVFNGLGNGTFASASNYFMSRIPQSNSGVRVVDMNGDGAEDVVVFSSDLIIMNGTCNITTDINSESNNNKINYALAYPNPVKDILTISADNSIKKIDVLNSIGQLVITKVVNDTTAGVEMKNLPAGIYFAQVYTGGGMITKKIIKE